MVDEVLLPSIPSDAGSGFWAPVKEWTRSRRGATSIRGGAWSIGGYVSTQVLRTVATLVLARHFLGPETFGLVGLVGVFVAGLGMFSELGILASVVQHPRGDDPKFLNTAFSIQAGRGLAIWVAATLAAYPIALFYKQPEIFPPAYCRGAFRDGSRADEYSRLDPDPACESPEYHIADAGV